MARYLLIALIIINTSVYGVSDGYLQYQEAEEQKKRQQQEQEYLKAKTETYQVVGWVVAILGGFVIGDAIADALTGE